MEWIIFVYLWSENTILVERICEYVVCEYLLSFVGAAGSLHFEKLSTEIIFIIHFSLPELMEITFL